jgi:hypothetical protein
VNGPWRLLILGLAVLSLAACGGSDETSGTTEASDTTEESTATASPEDDRLSHDEFVAQADAICGRRLSQLNAGPPPRSFAELAETMDKGTRVLRATVAELRSLKPPEEDEVRVDQMLAAFEANAATLSNVKAAALKQDQAGVEAAIASGEAPALQAGELAFELGLTVCSQPG